MIYLNHAATTYPKPEGVQQAVLKNLTSPPASQFRDSAHPDAPDPLSLCRKALGNLFQLSDWSRICFTSGATAGMNQLIAGMDLGERTIFATEIEHNSVLRPLLNQPRTRDREPVWIPCDENGEVTVETVEKTFQSRAVTKGILFLNHCSNVTGRIQDVPAIAAVCRRYGVWLVLDLSQSAGCIPIRLDDWQVDAAVFTGHKSLFGIQGTGGFWIRKEIPLRPLLFGGTGKDSARLTDFPEWDYEPGTRNMPGIEALLAGVRFVEEQGVSSIQKREEKQMKGLFQALSGIPGVHVCGAFEEGKQGPVISFNLEGLKPSDVGYILSQGYDIVVRTGLHCAPLHHRALGTQKDGTVRVSISCLTTDQEIRSLIRAVREIAEANGERED